MYAQVTIINHLLYFSIGVLECNDCIKRTDVVWLPIVLNLLMLSDYLLYLTYRRCLITYCIKHTDVV